MKKIIFSLIFLCCCVSSAMAMSNPLNSLAHPNVVQSSTCPQTSPTAPTFCTDILTSAICVCKIDNSVPSKALCTESFLKGQLNSGDINILKAHCVTEQKEGILPGTETVADCDNQIDDYRKQCV